MRYLTIIAAALWASTATAQTCAPRVDVAEILAENYGETVQSVMLTDNNMLTEVWANTQTGTWTITATHGNGTTCLILSGSHYEATPSLPAGEAL